MKNVKVLKIVNPLLACIACIQSVTALLMMMVDSVGETIREFHEWNGIVLLTVAVIHVSLNWSWIKTNYFTKRKAVSV